MSSRLDSNHLLYLVLSVITLGAISGLVWLNIYIFDDTEKTSFAIEIGKGLIQIITVAVIGSVIKLLIDNHQRLQKYEENKRLQAQQREERLQQFRMDKIQRLVGITNILRRAPVLIDAHRSAKTFNEQMHNIVDAGLELHMIRHETDAIGRPNPAFPAWPYISSKLREMEDYLKWIEMDFRKNSKELSELQIKAESNRRLQPEVWKQIYSLESVRDLLPEDDHTNQSTRYAKEYLTSYKTVLELMIKSSVQGENFGDMTNSTGDRQK